MGVCEKGKIAVFDSGVGGISFLHLAMKLLPQEDFIFLLFTTLFFSEIWQTPPTAKKAENLLKKERLIL